MAYAIAQPLLFNNHTYRRPVLGTRSDLKILNVESIRAFYGRHYVPNNMSIVIVGDIRNDDALEQVRRTFGVLPAQASKNNAVQIEHSVQPNNSVHRADVRQSVLMWSAVGPAFNDDTMAAVDVLTFILAEGESSWLHDILRSRTNWVNDVHADINKRKEASVIFLYASVDEQNVDNVRKAVPLILDSLATGAFADYEIERAKNQLKTTIEIEMQHSLGRASAMAQHDAMGDYTLANRYRQQIDEVSREDLARAARLYFKSEQFVLSAVVPKTSRWP